MQVSVTEAKGQLTELVRRAEAGDEIILTRHGHPAVAIGAGQSGGGSAVAGRAAWGSTSVCCGQGDCRAERRAQSGLPLR
jgi:antitoxin (DNA-binding transcriptional repressor) of toxin-antitoxin stability system